MKYNEVDGTESLCHLVCREDEGVNSVGKRRHIRL